MSNEKYFEFLVGWGIPFYFKNIFINSQVFYFQFVSVNCIQYYFWWSNCPIFDTFHSTDFESDL